FLTCFVRFCSVSFFLLPVFFFHVPFSPQFYTLSLHDALPISILFNFLEVKSFKIGTSIGKSVDNFLIVEPFSNSGSYPFLFLIKPIVSYSLTFTIKSLGKRRFISTFLIPSIFSILDFISLIGKL